MVDMDIKLIVTDLDGTYVDLGVASYENKRAVELAQAKGVKVVACTGRCWAMCDELIPTLGFDEFVVTSNGASIMHTNSGNIVYRQCLDPSWLPPLFEAAMASGTPFDVFCGPLIHTFVKNRSQWTVRCEAYASTEPSGQIMKIMQFSDYPSWIEATKDKAELFRVEVEPGMPYPPALQRAVDTYDMGSNMTMSFVDHYDLCHPQASKALAIDFLCKNLGIQKEHVMALGDSNNDIGMIRHAGLGIAMGDAADTVRAAADIVAPPGAQNGFAWAVHKFVLGHGQGE